MKIKYNKKRIFLKMKKIFVCRQLHSHLHMAGNCIKKGFQLHSEWKNYEKKVKVFLHFFSALLKGFEKLKEMCKETLVRREVFYMTVMSGLCYNMSGISSCWEYYSDMGIYSYFFFCVKE